MVVGTANVKHVAKIKKETEDREKGLAKWMREKEERKKNLANLHQQVGLISALEVESFDPIKRHGCLSLYSGGFS